MTKRYYYTCFDVNYLVKGLALIESINQHENCDFEIYIVCLDQATQTYLRQLGLSNIKTLLLADIERDDIHLQVAKQNRSQVEYYWSLKATLAIYLIRQHPEIDAIFYLDADLYFFSSPDPLWQAIENKSALIHEHGFAPEQAFLSKYGKFNAGMIGFRNDPIGVNILHWWRKHCLKWCHARLENGKFGDQLYLNQLPRTFDRVSVVDNIGVGVAPWNHIQYEFCLDQSGCALVNGTKIVFYHFHSLIFIEPEIITPSQHTSNPITEEILRFCFLPYINTLIEIQKRIKHLNPSFRFGLFKENVLSKDHTFIAHRSLSQRISDSDVPQPRIVLDETWDCYISEQLRTNPREKADPGVNGTLKPQNQSTNRMKMLNLGCGNRYHRDWVNLNFTSTGPHVIAHNLYKGIPFEDGLFDVVYHSHLLEHFPKRFALFFLKECHRVLKPGGVIRVAVPDLEQIARTYLHMLEKSMQGKVQAQNRYDWIMIELFDQMVRDQSGGEMLEYWRQQPMPSEEFVVERLGPKVKNTISALRNSPHATSRNGNLFFKAARDNNESDLKKLALFRVSGEVHQWMYDRYSLSKFLTQAGFYKIQQCRADESEIPDFNSYLLDIEQNGVIRKPDSLFIEAHRN
jgi:predicted SAM-dependent methyltransferase